MPEAILSVAIVGNGASILSHPDAFHRKARN